MVLQMLGRSARARAYAHQHDLSCLCVRIGAAAFKQDRKWEAEEANMGISPRDQAQLFACCVDAPEDLKFKIVHGISNHMRSWMDLDVSREIGTASPRWHGILSRGIDATDVMSNSGEIAYIMHVFHRRSKGRDQIHAVGQMENGQTVGLVDRCARPVLYLRCEDAAVWEPVVGDGSFAVVDTALRTLSGDPVVQVSVIGLPHSSAVWPKRWPKRAFGPTKPI